MAVPSKNFVSIPDGDVDADSPLTETLMTQIRDSLVHLEEWLGLDFIAAQNHDHDGANSKKIPAGAISSTIQSEGAQSLPSGSTWLPSEGVYNFVELAGRTYIELYIDSAWRRGTDYVLGSTLICDGTNMRFWNWSGPEDVYYQKF